MTATPIRLGVVGLGRAFTLMLPAWQHDPRIELVAAYDPRPGAREQFLSDFPKARTYDTVADLCADPTVELVYIASPHQFHAEQVCLAAAHGKHVLVEKPMALQLADCQHMIEACNRAGVHLLVGHSHSYDAPIQQAYQLLHSGRFGAVRMIQAQYYTDFLYRPRRPEELNTAAGGGVIHNQAAHQIDIIRLLGGGEIHSVRAMTGAWDPARPTEGAYAALLGFKNGVFASLLYSGYARFDSDSMMGDVSEMGMPKDPASYGQARRRLAEFISPSQESQWKAESGYGGSLQRPIAAQPAWHQHFGHMIISCEHADLHPSPAGLWVYSNTTRELLALTPPKVFRQEVVDELWAVLRLAQPALHTGAWGMATTEACLALLESAQHQTELTLACQVAPAAPPALAVPLP